MNAHHYLTLVTVYLILFLAWFRIDAGMAAIMAKLLEEKPETPARRKAIDKSYDDWTVCRIIFSATLAGVVLSVGYVYQT
jgi:hypothetical protein